MASNAYLLYGPGQSPVPSPSSNTGGDSSVTDLAAGTTTGHSDIAGDATDATETSKHPTPPDTPHKDEKRPSADSSDDKLKRNGASTQGCGLKVAERLKQLPVAQCAAGVYQAAKENPVAGKLVYSMEMLAVPAMNMTSYVCAPLLNACDLPIRGADWLLCRGLDITEKVFPCIAVPPGQMCGATRMCVSSCVCCLPRAVYGGVSSQICPVNVK